MTKKLGALLLIIAGLAGNLIAGWIQQDVFRDVFSPFRLAVIILIAISPLFIGDWLEKLAGLRPFWVFSLRNYRKALERAHEELHIPFRPNRPLKMKDVYVPLKVIGKVDSPQPVDAYTQIKKYTSIVVLGTPGAGKTMLLRHLAWHYANRGLNDFPKQPIPVLLDLKRLNDPKITLIDHLIKALEISNFPGADGFIKSFLKTGKLLLLLDGLDEVNVRSRERAVNQIKDLMSQYHEIRVVITCRTQIYREEFVSIVQRNLEIVDFNDRQIQRFLSAWEQDMRQKSGKSIGHLVQTLKDRPLIMAMARNPLLLTMIAYLYTDEDFVLPHSRSEFYSQATAILLDSWDYWKEKRNRFTEIQKRRVLQNLALLSQSGRPSSDTNFIELTKILSRIRDTLPGLALRDDDVNPILDEIVTRSSEPTAHAWHQKGLKYRQISPGKTCVKTARDGG